MKHEKTQIVSPNYSLFEPAVRNFLILPTQFILPCLKSAHRHFCNLSSFIQPFGDSFSFTPYFYLNFVDTVELLCWGAARNCTNKFQEQITLQRRKPLQPRSRGYGTSCGVLQVQPFVTPPTTNHHHYLPTTPSPNLTTLNHLYLFFLRLRRKKT